MNKYILVKHWIDDGGVSMVDTIEKKHLLDLKRGMCEAIIDTENETYFNHEKNKWVEIISK